MKDSKTKTSDIIINLKRCVQECPQADARLAKKYLDLLTEVESGIRTIESQFPAIKALIFESIELYDKNGETDNLADLYTASLGLIFKMNLFGQQDQSFVDKIQRDVISASSKYSGNPKIQFVKGQLLSRHGEQPEEAIAAYKACLSIEPQNSACMAAYNAEVASYKQLRCLGSDISSDLGFFIASTAATNEFTKKMKAANETYFLKRKPQLSARDIEVIVPIKSEFGDETLSVVFTNEGAKKLLMLTRSNIGKYLAVVLNGKILIVPQIREGIVGGRAQISPGLQPKNSKPEKYLFKQVCKKPVQPELHALAKIDRSPAIAGAWTNLFEHVSQVGTWRFR